MGDLIFRADPLWRKLQRVALAAAVPPILAVLGFLIGTRPALAEFEIQEAGIEKGEVEIEYRGAYHWGVPKQVDSEAEFLPGEVNDTVQSHEIEMEMGVTDWFLFTVTAGFDQPLGDNLDSSDVEVQTQFGIIRREGDGIALAFQLGYEQAFNHDAPEDGDANEFAFGPVIEWAEGSFLLTLNPLFGKQIGTFADQEGLSFEYGWRGEYDFTRHWGVGVEMFGEIEDLANAGSFNDQVHSIGPTLFFKPLVSKGDDEEVGDVGEDDDSKGNGKGPRPANTEFSMNVGVQFGLTDATSDTALKFQGTLSY